VLLCDDVRAFRVLLRASLEEDSRIAVVGEADDGLRGIEQAGVLQPDVVLLDLAMPRCDGMEAIPLMLERSPRTRIIALSGFSADRMAGPVLACGAHAYLEKGAEIHEIRAAVLDAASGRGPTARAA
jgi:DNA-binding NarL/FixJ family response regulator